MGGTVGGQWRTRGTCGEQVGRWGGGQVGDRRVGQRGQLGGGRGRGGDEGNRGTGEGYRWWDKWGTMISVAPVNPTRDYRIPCSVGHLVP